MSQFLSGKKILILGSSGGIGNAISEQLIDQGCELIRPGRELDISKEADWEKLAKQIKNDYQQIDGVINSLGVLHTESISPEKTFKHYNIESMQTDFLTNTISMAMAAKYMIPLFNRKNESLFVGVSAKVGSIGDNRIGGWGSYRASKAALNMILKNTLIELNQKKIPCRVLSIHPGTTHTKLSEPFSKNVKHKIHTPQETAANILSVIEESKPLSYSFFKNWDGTELPY